VSRQAFRWPLPLRIAFNELRGGLRDFRLFLACLIIGTAVIAAVGSLSQNIQQTIFVEAKTLLGGDVSLTATNQPMTPDQIAFFKQWGSVSEVVEMRAMAACDQSVALVELKGVDNPYPLLGELTRTDGSAAAVESGTILVATSLLDRLAAKIGDTITIGTAAFKIAGVIQKEPDNVSGGFSLGPRVIVRTDDLAKAGLLGPEELVQYRTRILLKQPSALLAFEQALKNQFPQAPWTVHTFHDANQGMGRFIDRLQLFLTLAGLATLLIGGIGILNATQAYLLHKMRSIAILKAVGASEALVSTSYALLLAIIATIGTVTGAMIGGITAWLILPHLAQFFPVDSSHAFHPLALAESIWFGCLTVAVFVVATLGRYASIQPALLFRSTGGAALGRIPIKWIAINVVFVLVLVVSLILTAASREIALGFIAASIFSIALLTGVTHLVQKAAQHLRFQRPWARLAASNIYRPGAATLSVILSIGIGLTVLITLLVVEGNFRNEVDSTLPRIAPSVFFVDIQPDQREAFIALVTSQPGLSELALKPMIRGRIATLNGIAVDRVAVKDSAKWSLESERGLSYAIDQPNSSPVIEGAWWDKTYRGPPLASLDKKLAQGMGLKVGDHIGLNIAGQLLDATIANLREVDYLTLQINFALILSPGAIEQFPATFLGTAHVDGGPSAEVTIMRAVTKNFPNVSTIDIRDQLSTFKKLVDQIAMAIRIIAMITLLAGLLVLASALTATLDRRAYDITIFKVLGASRSDITRSFLTEWMALATITGVVSAALGSGGAWLILYTMDWMHYQYLPTILAETSAAAIAVMMTIGVVIHRRIFSRRSLEFLRNG